MGSAWQLRRYDVLAICIYDNSYGNLGVFTLSALETQINGDHYKKLGIYQPFEVLKVWLTPEEYRGYMKGNAIAYLAREMDKGGDIDIEKATHTLQVLIESFEGAKNDDTD